MNKLLIALIIGVCICQSAYAEINIDRLADSIYQAEHSVKYPYGIKSINTHGDKVLARKICKNTIKHAIRDYKGQESGFIPFLGSRYCPTKGVALWEMKYNRNWVNNVTYYYNRE